MKLHDLNHYIDKHPYYPSPTEGMIKILYSSNGLDAHAYRFSDNVELLFRKFFVNHKLDIKLLLTTEQAAKLHPELFI